MKNIATSATENKYAVSLILKNNRTWEVEVIAKTAAAAILKAKKSCSVPSMIIGAKSVLLGQWS